MQRCLINVSGNRRRLVEPRPALLVRHLEEKKKRQLLGALSACPHRQAVLSPPKHNRRTTTRLPVRVRTCLSEARSQAQTGRHAGCCSSSKVFGQAEWIVRPRRSDVLKTFHT